MRKLADWLAYSKGLRRVQIGRERLRVLLHKYEISFQRTKTWKESTDPQREAKLARIEQVTAQFPARTFAFDEFGPLTIRPHAGAAGTGRTIPAGFRRTTTRNTMCGSSTASERALCGDGRPVVGAVSHHIMSTMTRTRICLPMSGGSSFYAES
ncbi:hypothetical protein ACGF3C_32985 [Micromonospora sp. NPDC047762]|uniref:hypothetical protein n=1 Tax=Micromonospora sp. NPDC047762 TaxID=3364255 RepID=UPI00371F2E47